MMAQERTYCDKKRFDQRIYVIDTERTLQLEGSLFLAVMNGRRG